MAGSTQRWLTSPTGSRSVNAPATAPSTRGRPSTTPTLLLQRAVADDQATAVALQDEALAIARDLGMRPLTERVLAHRKLLKA